MKRETGSAPERQGVPPERPRLAREFGELLDELRTEAHKILDVVIVGSGYGGSVAAHALAGLEKIAKKDGKRTAISVCVLERGKEYLPGEFPRRFEDMPGHLRHSDETTGSVTGNTEGLFDVRMGPDVVTLVANGVGGGSLINAGVLLEPELSDFEPASVAHALVSTLKTGAWYEKALQALGGRLEREGTWVNNTIDRHPDAARLRKTAALGTLGAGMTKPAISVSMDCAPNQAGVELSACELCGDCMSGCNVGAKDSLDANLLDLAGRAGAKVYSGASVWRLEHHRDDEGDLWTLHVCHTDTRLEQRETRPAEIRARHVILAAGTLGSTEILLRSRTDKLVFSPQLGQGFSCNGDNLAAVYDMASATQACADEDVPSPERFVGPTITGTVTMHTTTAAKATPARRSFQLQEFSIPGPMKRIFEEIITTGKVFNELPQWDPARHGDEASDALDPMAVDDRAIGRTLLVGMIGHDEADGVLYLPHPIPPKKELAQQGTIGIRWRDARKGARLEAAHKRVGQAVAALRTEAGQAPRLLANPMWRLLPEKLESLVSQPRGPVLTVHPLGGCCIGRRGIGREAAGVVDSYGRVHDFAASSRGRFKTLVVLDGSIIPGSLGVNPSLTITATAMRAMDSLRKDWAYEGAALQARPVVPVIWARRRALPAEMPTPGNLPGPPAGRGSTEIQIVERLRGAVPLKLGDSTRNYIVELTLAYRPLPIGRLMGRLQRQMTVDAHDEASRIRIYDESEWHGEHLKLERDEVRGHWALFEGRLSGTLAVLGREPSRPWWRILRSVSAWFVNRGTRDIVQRVTDPTPAQQEGRSDGICSYVRSLFRMGTHAGEVRRLDYDLAIAELLPVKDCRTKVDMHALQIGIGDVIRGSKRLTYGLRANPWRQLTLMTLDQMPQMNAALPPVLELDGCFLAGQGFPLLRITRQRNSAVALADLCSFGLYMTRLLVTIHLWTFRKPDTQPKRRPDRLPGRVAGLVEPEISELVVDRYPGTEKPVTIRLTRYRQTIGPRVEPGRPLVLIHGYSASGNTFTHPSLPANAAAYFCTLGRDVWVVDLRTSAALPSCTYPWSMEQVGLIDIPAALMHIRGVTNQRVDVLAHCIGCVMLSMALLSDASEIRNNTIELGPDTWLTNYQLGLLEAFNGQSPEEEHPVIRKLILSQKGPVLRYTDHNILRAFVLQSARRWLMQDDYQFQPSDTPGVMEELMDRFLASIPYPDADYDIENPFCPLARVPWTATRHRMDALYGRAFDASNMSPRTLAAINDIFGPISLETVSQTMHFARVDAITNQAGRGEFVTRERLRRRWGGIDTYAIHGANNGLVDVLTQTLLREHLKSAGVPFSEPPPNSPVYATLGHQDVLMGIHSRAVFDDLQAFLQRAPVDSWSCERPDVVMLPWSGPRLALPLRRQGDVRIACLSDPTQGSGRLYLVPALRWTSRQGEHRYEIVDDVACISSSRDGSSAHWMFAKPDVPGLTVHRTALRQGMDGTAVLGWLALVVYPAGETRVRLSALDKTPAPAHRPSGSADPPASPPAAARRPNGDLAREAEPVPNTGSLTASVNETPAPPAGPQVSPGSPARSVDDPRSVLEGVKHWLDRQRSDELELAFVELSNVESAQATAAADTPTPSFAFALGSCQYVTGLVDAKVGQASLNRLARMIDTAPGRVDLALFMGDQIYADATAGLIDPTRRDERYEQPNDKAMRAAGMRAVLRRVPAQMLLDDHELNDNWEPLPPAVARRRPDAEKRNRQSLERGARAWANFQRMSPLRAWEGSHGVGDLEFMAGGLPFRFADTRTGRSARGSTTRPLDRKILNDRQRLQLKQWLLAHKDEVKFIVTPSILLPRRRTAVASEVGNAHADAWDAFPTSMDELFSFLVNKQITNTVFLSGDEHHSMLAEAVLTSITDPTKNPIKIVSVHSSGLYAPFPFANGHPDEMEQRDSFSFASVDVDASTRFAPIGDGFARLQVLTDGNGPVLGVEWIKADGQVFAESVELRCAERA